MNARDEARPTRDFTDVAIWRASLVAIVVGYLLSIILTAAWTSAAAGQFDPARLALALPELIGYALNPAAMVAGFCGMAVMLVLGFFVMAAYKGDHTTYPAALIIGARTAGIGFAILFIIGLIVSRGAIVLMGSGGAFGPLSSIVQLALACAMMLAVGALTGVAARVAAGAPKIEVSPEAA